MAPPTNGKVEEAKDSSESTAKSNANEPKIPTWINEENFLSVFEENVDGFRKVLNFEVKETGGGGENYASMMMRVKAKVELTDNSTKDIAFMIKIVPQGEQGAAMVNMMGLFPKEATMYGKYLREFEETYRSVGKTIKFGPKFYKLKTDPGVEYILLEDISPKGFKNVNRLEGLDKEHTKSVLKRIAELHAVSAVRFEQQGDYEPLFMVSPFTEDSREQLETMMGPLMGILRESYKKHPTGLKYLPKVTGPTKDLVQKFIDIGKLDRDSFNVMVHGDLWANNIMFRHNDEGKLQETMLVDFQMCRFSSPSVDLFYFLLSSPSLDVKCACFDEFIKYYHENLVENLELLNYPKKLPTMKQLREDLLKYSSWGVSTLTGILGAVLLDPTEKANIDNFFDDNKDGNDFRMQLYDNPRYIRHLDVILPWMDTMGYLDDS